MLDPESAFLAIDHGVGEGLMRRPMLDRLKINLLVPSRGHEAITLAMEVDILSLFLISVQQV